MFIITTPPPPHIIYFLISIEIFPVVYYSMKYDHLKKEMGLLQLQIISDCYFLQFSLIMKLKTKLLIRIRNSVQNVYIVTIGCDSVPHE